MYAAHEHNITHAHLGKVFKEDVDHFLLPNFLEVVISLSTRQLRLAVSIGTGTSTFLLQTKHKTIECRKRATHLLNRRTQVAFEPIVFCHRQDLHGHLILIGRAQTLVLHGIFVNPIITNVKKSHLERWEGDKHRNINIRGKWVVEEFRHGREHVKLFVDWNLCSDIF